MLWLVPLCATTVRYVDLSVSRAQAPTVNPVLVSSTGPVVLAAPSAVNRRPEPNRPSLTHAAPPLRVTGRAGVAASPQDVGEPVHDSNVHSPRTTGTTPAQIRTSSTAPPKKSVTLGVPPAGVHLAAP